MVGEVNKIIYNMLISGRGVFLPEVGSLFIERQGARRISKERLLSPRNVVTYSTQEQAPSLVSEIVKVAGCSQEQAQDIYERWLAKTRDGKTLTIGGVGVLNHRSFSTESAFGAAINPKGVKTLIIRRRSNGWLYAICAVCVLIALGFFGYIMWGDELFGDKDTSAPAATELVAIQPALNAEPVADTTAVAEAPAPCPMGGGMATEAPATSKEYAHYVVMGIFSTEQNAALAVEQVKAKINDAECVVLPFKNKFMVTIFGSNNRSDCNAYAKSYKDIYPDLWVYNRQ